MEKDNNLKIRIPSPKPEDINESETKIKSQKYSIFRYLLYCMCFC
jgi:hypothetical protein